jgi:NADPH2:quinone reductase
MPSIRAVVADPNAVGHLSLASVEPPVPLPTEAVVRVRALSLNRGETNRAQRAPAGWRPGWDIAGTVEQAAAEGGPRVGDRVVGMINGGAWAELVAIPTTNLAVLPDNVSFEQASTIPVAGLTALYALDRANGLVERNVLVTGASGGVGNYAIQIAKHGGAHVTGLARQEKHLQALTDAGAEHAVADATGKAAAQYGPFDVILESVGGEVLTNALSMIAPVGQMICYGVSGASGPVSLDSTLFLRTSAQVSGLRVFTEQHKESAAVGMARLVRMISAGTLKPLIAVQAPWSEIGSVAQQLLDRSYPGKAVLAVS